MPNYHTYIVTDDGRILESNQTQLPLAAQVAFRINLSRHDIPGRPTAILERDGKTIESAPVSNSARASTGCDVDHAEIILHMMLCGGWHRRDLIDAMKVHAGITVSRSRVEQWMRRGSASVSMLEVALVAQVLCAEAFAREGAKTPLTSGTQ